MGATLLVISCCRHTRCVKQVGQSPVTVKDANGQNEATACLVARGWSGMNPNLLHAVRERMRERSNDELIALWVTNDRAMYSPEAFEAVKSLLAERGVTHLPPQSDPAPVAQRGNDPEAVYWMQWLRPVLWIGIVLGSLGLAQQLAGAWEVYDRAGTAGFRLHSPGDVVVGVVTTLLLPVWLVVASIGCLRRHPVGRMLLLLWAWTAILVGVVSTGRQIAGRLHMLWWAEEVTYQVTTVAWAAQGLVLPTILVVLLRRPEIRSLFTAAGAPGFDPSLTDPTPPPPPPPPTAPAGTPPNPASPAGSSSPEAQC